MRQLLSSHGILCPTYQLLTSDNRILNHCRITYPLIVKPVDRSGSRGVSLVYKDSDLESALDLAFSESFSKMVLVEQYIEGREISVEGISQKGEHQILTITDKITTGAPHFVELGHSEPSSLSFDIQAKVENVTLKILDVVGMSNGASHTEFRITEKGDIYLIEIGSRMGGDFIGSDLVWYSTGFDFVKAVIDVAIGVPLTELKKIRKDVSIVFFTRKIDYEKFLENQPLENIIRKDVFGNENQELKSSADRYSYIIYYR